MILRVLHEIYKMKKNWHCKTISEKKLNVTEFFLTLERFQTLKIPH